MPWACIYCIPLGVCVNHGGRSTFDSLLQQQIPSLARHSGSLKHHRRQNNKDITYKHHDRGQWFSLTFSIHLFWLLMIGYQIPISLSCSLPSLAPCCSLEDCFGEHLEAGC